MRASIAVAVLILLTAPAGAQPMPLCGSGHRVTCVVDGDTFWLEGVKVRLEGIDAPEIDHAACRAERRLGDQARDRLAHILGQPFTLERRGRAETDRYGRLLRTVVTGDTTAGAILIGEGLARVWPDGPETWCAP